MAIDDNVAPSVASRRQIQTKTPSPDERTSSLCFDRGQGRPQISTVERKKLPFIQLDQKLATAGPNRQHPLRRRRANECSTEPHSGRGGNKYDWSDPRCAWSDVVPF